MNEVGESNGYYNCGYPAYLGGSPWIRDTLPRIERGLLSQDEIRLNSLFDQVGGS
jgi:hypothetical protein